MKNTEYEEFMKATIKNGSPLCFLRSTPFTEHSEFNYNGILKEEFFFKNLFSKKGRFDEYINIINNALSVRSHKTILLTGSQGCGKTTFAHCLKHECSGVDFLFFDFDQNTSHPKLEEYIERLSNYLHNLLCKKDNTKYNIAFYDLFATNQALITQKINAGNNINNFFENFYKTFVLNEPQAVHKNDFILEINKLFFNQILSLIALWHLSKMALDHRTIRPIVFCLDNLDVLVNQEIIERFFKEYFRFIRNIDGIINRLDYDYIRNNSITYNSVFSFVLVCRQHTWARVKQHYPHHNPAIHLSTLALDVTEAFDKNEILAHRNDYIHQNSNFFGRFATSVSNVCSLLNDMDPVTSQHKQNIYDLFNNDYRKCTITFEDLLNDNPDLLDEYISVKKRIPTVNQGLRGIIYRALFEKFKRENILSEIGVLDILRDYPFASTARLLLNYLNYMTYGQSRCVPFSRIVADFEGIISKAEIDLSLIAMFNLGFNSSWNELVAFNEINTETIETCENTELMITTAGHEYLNFIANHFEYFNTRVPFHRYCKTALFSPKSMEAYPRSESYYSINDNKFQYMYNFEEIIFNVIRVVERCCSNMSKFFNKYMAMKYSQQQYLHSPYVYGDSNVLHGERIIHTHIRYIDNFRLYLLNYCTEIPNKEVNEILIRFIEEYIRIGENYPNVLTERSTINLFPAFKERIQEVRDSGYTSMKPINIR